MLYFWLTVFSVKWHVYMYSYYVQVLIKELYQNSCKAVIN